MTAITNNQCPLLQQPILSAFLATSRSEIKQRLYRTSKTMKIAIVQGEKTLAYELCEQLIERCHTFREEKPATQKILERLNREKDGIARISLEGKTYFEIALELQRISHNIADIINPYAGFFISRAGDCIDRLSPSVFFRNIGRLAQTHHRANHIKMAEMQNEQHLIILSFLQCQDYASAFKFASRNIFPNYDLWALIILNAVEKNRLDGVEIVNNGINRADLAQSIYLDVFQRLLHTPIRSPTIAASTAGGAMESSQTRETSNDSISLQNYALKNRERILQLKSLFKEHRYEDEISASLAEAYISVGAFEDAIELLNTVNEKLQSECIVRTGSRFIDNQKLYLILTMGISMNDDTYREICFKFFYHEFKSRNDPGRAEGMISHFARPLNWPA